MAGFIYGASGFGNEVLAITERALSAPGNDLHGPLRGFVDDDPSRWGSRWHGRPVYDPSEALAGDDPWFVVAIGATRAKQRVCERLVAAGVTLPSIIDPSATVLDPSGLGQGVVILPGAFVSSAVRIGAFGFVGPLASVSHDCTLGLAATVNPGARIAGHCVLGDRVYVGVGATLRDRIVVGDDVVVGAGAVVVAEVASGLTVVGVPARPLRSS